MNQKEFRLYQALDTYSIPFEILQVVSFEIMDLVQYNRHGYLVYTVNGPKALWIFRGPEKVLIGQSRLFAICKERKMDGFLYPLPLNDGRMYGKLDDRTWFYLTDWPELQPVSYRKDRDLQGMVHRVAQFRRMAMELELFPEIEKTEEKYHNFLDVMKNAIDNLQSFEMLANHRLRPTRFDELFLREYPFILEKARQGYELLAKSEYSKILSESGCRLIIYNLTRGNIHVDRQGIVYILHLKNCCYDMSIVDFAILLIKSGRFNQWSKLWFRQMWEWYQAYFAISFEEYEIIKALLHFPWNIYRLAERYYFNRTEWTVFRFLEKLDRQLADKKFWLEFIDTL
ncbi:MAG TPA: hypothetical protein PLC07_00005 [Bacillota bacterium]|nr:hypothetical protein [Bacillota bacterium]